MKRRFFAVCTGAVCTGIFVACHPAAGAEPPGGPVTVTVNSPTRIDWTFAVATQSLAAAPGDWLGDYDSTTRRYERFVPPGLSPKQPCPLVIFVSPGADPGGWPHFELPCRQLGMAYAGLIDAGNQTPPKHRVRMVLDVLDDVRRIRPIDPDRTYLAGFSGGGRIACAVAFGLPEYFGGVIPVCSAGEMRGESWLRQRVVDRLSVALVTGETDFNRGEVERFRGPVLRDVGVRTKVWVQPKMGHAVPPGAVMLDVCRWLDDGAAKRRAFGAQYPAGRQAGDSPTRKAWSEALLAEGKKRTGHEKSLYSGLMQLKGCMERWPDLPAAAEARKILLDHEAKPDHPWEADDIAEQRRYLIAEARGLDAYASGPLPAQYAGQRADMLKQAISLWSQVLEDGPETPAGREAKKRLPVLRKMLDEK